MASDPQSSPADITDALYDSAYIAGLKAGWNFCAADNAAGLQASVAARAGYLAPIAAKRKGNYGR